MMPRMSDTSTATGSGLRLRDVRRVFRLIGEIRERGHNPDEWRQHMVRRLADMFDAEVVVSSEVHVIATASPERVRVIDIGWGLYGNEAWRVQTENDDVSPETYRLAIPAMAAKPVVEAPPPHGHPAEGERLPVKPKVAFQAGSSLIFSQYLLPHLPAVDQLAVHRAALRHPFEARDHRLIRLLHVELGRLWRRDALKQTTDPQSSLPPRLAQTLNALVEGKSEKQVAIELGISPHTLHNYVKALHKRFNVSSRGELVSKAMSARQDFVPKLARPGAAT
jgi:DNA-binding CsgD family transcriptional regulator